MPTNTQRITTLEAWKTAHDAKHAANPLHAHTPPPIVVPPSVLLDTRAQGWGMFGQMDPPGDPGDKQDCYYTDSRSRVSIDSANRLTATLVKSPRTFPADVVPNRPWGGVRLSTNGTFAVSPSKNGTRIAATLRYPFIPGLYPAGLWLLESGRITTPPEVDVHEHPCSNGPAGNDPQTASFTNWIGAPGTPAVNEGYGLFTGSTWADDAFHEFAAVLYSADAAGGARMEFFADGVKFNTVVGSTKVLPPKPMHLIFEAGLGGQRGSAFHVDPARTAPIAVVWQSVVVSA